MFFGLIYEAGGGGGDLFIWVVRKGCGERGLLVHF